MKFPSSQLLTYIDYPERRSQIVKNIMEQVSSWGVEIKGFIAKGLKSTVFKGVKDGEVVAVKILRSDTVKKEALIRENEFLERLKGYGFSPRPYFCSPSVLVMEFIEGVRFRKAMDVIGDVFEKKKLVLRAIEACYTMDVMNIKHSELSGGKHVLVSKGDIKIIDFESAHFSQKALNLTQFMGYYILRDKKLLGLFGITRKAMLGILSDYKTSPHTMFNVLTRLIRSC